MRRLEDFKPFRMEPPFELRVDCYTEEQARNALPRAHAAVETLKLVNSAVDYVPAAGELNRHVITGLLDGCEL